MKVDDNFKTGLNIFLFKVIGSYRESNEWMWGYMCVFWLDCILSLEFMVQVFVTDLWADHTPWPFNQLPRSYSFLVKHGPLWKMTYYGTAPRVVHQSNFAATGTFIAR